LNPPASGRLRGIRAATKSKAAGARADREIEIRSPDAGGRGRLPPGGVPEIPGDFETFDRAVQRRFPEAEAWFAVGMPGCRIARRRWIDPKAVNGTLDPNWVQMYLVERKSGITLPSEIRSISRGCSGTGRTSPAPDSR